MFFSINRSEGLCVYFTKYWCSALFGRILLDFFFGKKGPEGRRFLESTAAEEVVGESSDHCFRCSTFYFLNFFPLFYFLFFLEGLEGYFSEREAALFFLKSGIIKPPPF